MSLLSPLRHTDSRPSHSVGSLPKALKDYCYSPIRERFFIGAFSPAGRFEMAEYTQKGILTALLFFSAVTLRDIYVGRSQSQQQGPQASDSLGMAEDSLPDAGTTKPGKPSLYTGPVLKFQYW